MTARVIAVFSIKGGVGKTTSAANLAYCAAAEGKRTLLWDLDPQGATTFYFRIKQKIKGGLGRLADKPKKIESQIKASDFDLLDVLPADYSYRLLERIVLKSRRPEKFMRRILKPVLDQYDVIFVDCPPHLSEAMRSLFSMVDLVLVPSIPTVLSIRTLNQLLTYLKKEMKSKVRVRAFFTLVEGSRKMHREIIDSTSKKSSLVLPIAIPNHSIVEKMGARRAPLGAFAADSKAARAYRALWKQVSASSRC